MLPILGIRRPLMVCALSGFLTNVFNFAYTIVSPARFYVSMVVKMILVHVIKHYDIKLADVDAPPHFSWGINLVTHPSLVFLVRPRGEESL